MIDIFKQLIGPKTYYIKKKAVIKDEDYGHEEEIYGTPEPVELYGEQPYTSTLYNDPNGIRKDYELLVFNIGEKQNIQERDFICINVSSDADPDYQVGEIDKFPFHQEIYLKRRIDADARR